MSQYTVHAAENDTRGYDVSQDSNAASLQHCRNGNETHEHKLTYQVKGTHCECHDMTAKVLRQGVPARPRYFAKNGTALIRPGDRQGPGHVEITLTTLYDVF